MGERVIAPIHPGRILKEEFLEPMGITPNNLAVRIEVPSQRVYEIISGKRAISLDTALRLAKFFGTSHHLWLGLQAEYELQKAQDSGLVDRIEREVRPLPPEKRMDVRA